MEQKIENVLRDTRKNVRYVIMASRKLTREEMLKQIRYFNYDPVNIRQKPNSTVIIHANEH